jgi:superfamily II DNA helicase RecQ
MAEAVVSPSSSNTAAGAVALAFQQLQTEYTSLKLEQESAAISILEGKDVFAVLPTGFGKTTILAVLPIAFDILRGIPLRSSLVLCLSPLISLMNDQLQRLRMMGLEVDAILSGQDSTSIIKRLKEGQYQILIMSPEMIISNSAVRSCLQHESVKSRVKCVVIDEAHCIVSW